LETNACAGGHVDETMGGAIDNKRPGPSRATRPDAVLSMMIAELKRLATDDRTRAIAHHA
jgi:hypothetical protein